MDKNPSEFTFPISDDRRQRQADPKNFRTHSNSLEKRFILTWKEHWKGLFFYAKESLDEKSKLTKGWDHDKRKTIKNIKDATEYKIKEKEKVLEKN